MTDVEGIARELRKEMEKYSSLVKEEFEAIKKETSKTLVQAIKLASPKRTGSYKKGWRMKKTSKGYVIHNKTDYQLTHLLEYSHVKKGGGRTEGKPHIRPAEERAIKDFLKKIKKAVKQ